MKDEKIAIIGLGNVGTAMALALQSAGCSIVAVCARRAATLERNGRDIVAAKFIKAEDAAKGVDVILITTQDDAIGSTCEQLAEAGAIKDGAKVLHLSGACGLEPLQPARTRGASIACIHPIQSFTKLETSLENIPHTVFGVTGDEEILPWCYNLVRLLGGTPIRVNPEDKALYHAASCVTSSYLATLLFLVEEMYHAVGMSSEEARRTYLPLIKGTLRNIEARGPVLALSGPIARGDGNTIAAHLAGIGQALPHLLPVYVEMGLNALRVAEAKGTLKDEQAHNIREILKGGLA